MAMDQVGLDRRLARLAEATALLVATDYDGTLSPIVPDPTAAIPVPGALETLAELSRLPATEVAIVSGRSLEDLRRFVPAPGGVRLVGSHGAEFGNEVPLPVETMRLAREVDEELRRIAGGVPGAWVEVKPASAAFHYRNAIPRQAAAALAEVLAGPATREGVHVKLGKMVVELAVIDADKGEAIERLRRILRPSAVLFAGDDVTDEDAFAVLGSPDLGIKVGEGGTRATFAVPDPPSLVRILGRLAARRAGRGRPTSGR